MKKNFYKLIVLTILLFIVAIGCKKDTHVIGVTLDKNDITLNMGETATLTATISPKDATNKAVSWTSSNTDVATVTNGIVTAKETGATIITVTTHDGSFTAKCAVKVAPEWMEINGVKWATRNVNKPGTFTAKPEDAGMFYQWNSKTGWSSTDPLVNHEGGTTWDITIPEGDTWEIENDPCPQGWRIPTLEEFISLINAGSKWKSEGVTGRIFGSGNNTIFLPAAGFRDDSDGTLFYVGNNGIYWSSTPFDGGTPFDSNSAYEVRFGSVGADAYGGPDRRNGSSVRCVAE
jgi:uncharacterized protein (TIGR02145 family)